MYVKFEKLKEDLWDQIQELVSGLEEDLDDPALYLRFMADLREYLDHKTDDKSLGWIIIKSLYDNEDGDDDEGFMQFCERISELWNEYPASQEGFDKEWFDGTFEGVASRFMDGDYGDYFS